MSLIHKIRLHEDYQHTFDSPQGKNVLKHICHVGFINRSTFVKGDPHETALNEGSRRLALSILRFLYRDNAEMIRQIEQQET